MWIDAAQRDQAQTMGYTVVDASTVGDHLSELLQSHAHELLGHDEVQQLLDNLAQVAPKLVEDLVPKRCRWPWCCARIAEPAGVGADSRHAHRLPKRWRSRRPKVKMPAL